MVEVFGYGIRTYFKVMKIMMYMMVAIIVLLIPTMVVYRSEGHFRNMQSYWQTQFMLGNLGMRAAQCFHHYIGFTLPLYIECDTGRLSDNITFGLMPDDHGIKNDFCGLTTLHQSVNDCSQKFLNMSMVESEFINNCFNKKKCNFDPNLMLINVKPPL